MMWELRPGRSSDPALFALPSGMPLAVSAVTARLVVEGRGVTKWFGEMRHGLGLAAAISGLAASAQATCG